MTILPRYEIKKWRRLKRDAGLAFSGDLYYDGRFECGVLLATVAVTEFSHFYILEDLKHKYIMFKSQEQS